MDELFLDQKNGLQLQEIQGYLFFCEVGTSIIALPAEGHVLEVVKWVRASDLPSSNNSGLAVEASVASDFRKFVRGNGFSGWIHPLPYAPTVQACRKGVN